MVLTAPFDPAKLPPTTKWTAERHKLADELKVLNREYQTLKTETVEKIKRNIDDILNGGARTQQRKRNSDMER